jgi:hypothetical protein
MFFKRRMFFFLYTYKENQDPWGGANCDPRALLSTNFVYIYRHSLEDASCQVSKL